MTGSKYIEERIKAPKASGPGLSEEQSETLMTALAAGSVEPALAGALLVALSMFLFRVVQDQ